MWLSRTIARGPRLLSLLLAACPAAAAVSNINVGMKASFSAGPYLLELLETAAGENASSYFPLLDRIANGHFHAAQSELDLYQSFLITLKEDGCITTPEALSTFNLALSLRSAAPRIEAHYHFSDSAVDFDSTSAACSNWVFRDGSVYCKPEMDKLSSANNIVNVAHVQPFDRTVGQGPDAILHADIESPDFAAFHNKLYQDAKNNKVTYRLRYRRDKSRLAQPLPVNGYGVELALKKTDYIVIDDRDATPGEYRTPSKSKVDLNQDDEIDDLQPLSQSELSGLGMKASSLILSDDSPLSTLVKLTQDFPKFAHSIVSHHVPDGFADTLRADFASEIPSGVNLMFVNGMQLIERQIQAHGLVDILRRERTLVDQLRRLGFSGKEAVHLIGHDSIVDSKADSSSNRYDWTDSQEEGKAILWLNDVENDARYDEYPKSLSALLQRTFPGQLPPIGLNVFFLVVPIDFADAADLEFVEQLHMLLDRGAPIRIGLVPLTPTEVASRHAKFAYHVAERYGAPGILEILKTAQKLPGEIDWSTVLEDKSDSLTPLEETTPMTSSEVLSSAKYAQQVKLAQHWSRRLSAQQSAPRIVFANGSPIVRDKKWLQAMSMQIGQDLQLLQQLLMYNGVPEGESTIDVFLTHARSSRNIYIETQDADVQLLDMSKVRLEHQVLFEKAPTIAASPESSKESWGMLVTVSDFESEHGLELMLNALRFRRDNPGMDMILIHNPPDPAKHHNLQTLLTEHLSLLEQADSLEDLKSVSNTKTTSSDPASTQRLVDFLQYSQIESGESKLILNGRVIGPFTTDHPFQQEDFQTFFESEYTQRIGPVNTALRLLNMDDKVQTPSEAAELTSLVALSAKSILPQGIFDSAPNVRTSFYEDWKTKGSAIEVGDPETASIQIVGLLNPLSEQGQRWAPILKALSELDGVYLKLFLNPKEMINELPIKRFYRYVLDSKPTFNADGALQDPRVSFKGLPSEALLTMGVDVPPAWLVASKESHYDLDNIKLSSASSDVDATYELEHILIEGHSRGANGEAPRGAQLVLSAGDGTFLDDTIVMANLGFFQFKANPGMYNIQLKEGRSREIFTINNIGTKGYQSAASNETIDVSLMDFQGTTLYPRLLRNPGMEKEDVLESPEDSDSMLSKGLKFAERLLGSSKPGAEHKQADINIFSVASGHLYERMLNIMMVSVMKNTKHTVKFWFIEQFLSPSFKAFIPHMAQEYGFQYEMITYKWPHWLRQQKEKQREIWGYKILFLDVLFPLSLDKVIFVDADQIVRTDMISLVEHDLEGAPYGFTPMCDSRTEMEGFRFWKQGYWKNYLRGHPYHISALYVVDLRRFRALAAGDRLRQQYHSLSADPNSLSNLDQDLPNHMQFSIPIHSLPQEWLWCETWCSDEAFGDAKTIDLCNNPQTKEPKLDRARRQVPEWTEYDEEIATLAKRVQQQASHEKVETKKEDVNTKSRRLEEQTRIMDEL